MVDATMDIPQLVCPGVDSETPRTQAAAVAKVLDDDNLLREIIVHVGFPTTLVRVALVCKRWLGHASDPKFLCRFHKLHPPRLLGYYIAEGSVSSHGFHSPRFVPMLPQPPELAAVIRLLESYRYGAHKIVQCRNGSVFTWCHEGRKVTGGVHRPLCVEKGMQIVPPLPHANDHNVKNFSAIVSKEEGSGLSYLYVLGASTGEAGKSMAHVYMLQDGVWHMRTSATCLHVLHFCPESLLVDDKIYMPAASSDSIIVFDMTAPSFSAIQLSQGVKYRHLEIMLSRADDASGVYLIHFHVKEFKLRIWLHNGDNWLLVDTICLHEMLATLGISNQILEDECMSKVDIRQVRDNGQFVFLQMGQCTFFLDIKCRTLCNVYENTLNDRWICSIYPFMMIWPPIFPAIKEDPARFPF